MSKDYLYKKVKVWLNRFLLNLLFLPLIDFTKKHSLDMFLANFQTSLNLYKLRSFDFSS